MKKLIAMLLALVMVLSLAACGGGSEKPIEPPKTTEAPTATDAPEVVATEAPTEPVVTEPPVNLTVHENTLFTVGYNEEEGWSLAEDDIALYDDGGSAELKILENDGDSEVEVYIYAMIKPARNFRESMATHNVDMQGYVNGTVETVEIGGMAMLEAPRGENGRFFFGRDEASGMYCWISTYEYNDPRVVELIQNITFTPVGTDNIDPPWPWEGVPFDAGTASQEVEGFTVTAEFLPMSERQITYDTMNHSVEILGDKVYILSEVEMKLRQYTMADGALTLDKVIELDYGYSIVESANGELVLSQTPSAPVIFHNGETVTKSFDGVVKLALAPDGTWGISSASSGEKAQKVTFTEEGMSKESFPFNEVKQVRYYNIDDKYIYVAGTPVDSNDHTVFVYNHSGELQMTLGAEPDGKFKLGSITYVARTANGFVGVDANYRDLVLWAADGTWLGSVDGNDLFGTSYPWIMNADVMDDGSILVIMSEERADHSAIEILAYKVSVS